MLANEVFFAGNAGKDAETRNLPNGKLVAQFSLAYTDKHNDKETTTWMTVVAFGSWAETAATIKKGDNVIVRGKIQTRTWEKDGKKNYATEIVAFSLGIVQKGPQASRKAHGQWTQEDIAVPF